VLTPQREDIVPTYQYACTDCGERTEKVQKFTDEPLSVCSACGGRLRKVFSPVGIVFKGSGFYRTDSRNAAVPANGGSKDKDKEKSGSSASESSGSSSGDSGGSGSSGGTSESGSSAGDKKAAAPAASSSGSSSSSGGSSGSKVA
jgi:putative FmdB family regulatory protein